MKKVAKKVFIYSMVGLLQAGLFATVTEAAAKPNDLPPGYDQRKDPRKDNDKKKVSPDLKKNNDTKKVNPAPKKVDPPNMKDNNKHQQDIDRKTKAEKQRHESEMKRRPNESDRDWQKRQQQEKQRHEKNLKEIQAKK